MQTSHDESQATERYDSRRYSHSPERYVLNGSGAAAASEELEHRAQLAIEVVVLWRGDVLAVRHLSPPGAFYVGDACSACDVALPAELLGSEQLCIAVGSRNEVSAVLPPQARGWLTLPDGSTRPLGVEARASEQLLPLGLGHRAHLCFGGIEVQVAAVAAGRAPALRRTLGFERSTLAYFGFSSLSVAGLLAVLSLMAPPLGLTQDESGSQERMYRLQSYLTASAERALQQQELASKELERSAAAVAPPRSRPEAPRAEPEAEAEAEAEAEQHTAPEPEPTLEAPQGEPRTAADRKGELEEARSFGIIGLMAKNMEMLRDPRLPFQRELTSEELAAMNQMYNSGSTWEEGPGGLALSGTGRRGGGKANALPLESVGTVSGGQGTLPEGYAGFGSPSGSFRPSAPELRPAEALAASPASVRRTINAQFPRIRACYEEGLRSNPALPGKAVVSFVLQPEGHADQVSAQSSSLPSSVVSCIEGVFRDISFPHPPEPLPVKYPVQLAP
ncbi:MAG: hypothetical protein RL685_2847 [Pseudomonadota bacterium]